MSGPADIDALAAEYVLGTLDPAERLAVAARLQREPALRAAVETWERRLGPLADLSPLVAPPPALAAKIEQLIAAAPTVAPTGADLINLDLQRRLRRADLPRARAERGRLGPGGDRRGVRRMLRRVL